jgi:hypothetical protein
MFSKDEIILQILPSEPVRPSAPSHDNATAIFASSDRLPFPNHIPLPHHRLELSGGSYGEGEASSCKRHGNERLNMMTLKFGSASGWLLKPSLLQDRDKPCRAGNLSRLPESEQPAKHLDDAVCFPDAFRLALRLWTLRLIVPSQKIGKSNGRQRSLTNCLRQNSQHLIIVATRIPFKIVIRACFVSLE